MDAKKCDRCGEYFETIPEEKSGMVVLYEFIKSGLPSHEANYAKDLCPKCKKEFEEWLGEQE